MLALQVSRLSTKPHLHVTSVSVPSQKLSCAQRGSEGGSAAQIGPQVDERTHWVAPSQGSSLTGYPPVHDAGAPSKQVREAPAHSGTGWSESTQVAPRTDA